MQLRGEAAAAEPGSGRCHTLTGKDKSTTQTSTEGKHRVSACQWRGFPRNRQVRNPRSHAWRRLSLSVALFAGFCIGAEAEENTYHSDPAAKWHGWLEFGGYYGTDRTSRGEATVFAPIVQTPDSLFFLDIKGKFFEQNNQEGNFALGYRKMTDSGFNLGAWVGTDIRATSLDNTFWQFSGGVEALSHNYDFRANFYIPLTDPKAGGAGLTQVHLQGNSIFMTGGQEVPLGGADAEAGFRIPLEKLNESFSAVELRAYGGGYYFDSSDANQEVAGGKARLELRVPDVFEALPGSQLTAGYQFTYDDVRQSRHQAGLKLRIPFGEISDADSDRSVQLASLLPQERRMLDGIERDTDIVVTASGRESVIDDATNVALDRVAYASDLATLQAAIGQGANTHIIVRGSGTEIDVTSLGGIQLQDSQTIQGGGSIILLRGASSGTVAGFSAPGSRPTLASSDASFRTGVVMMAANTHAAGLKTLGGYAGIFGGSGLNNVVIEQNEVSRTLQNGIQMVDANTNFAVLGNRLFDIGDDGIDIGDDNSSFVVAGNAVGTAPAIGPSGPETGSDIGDDGIDIGDYNSFFAVANNVIRNTDDKGVSIADDNSDFVVAQNDIRHTGGRGIWVDDRNTFVGIIGNTISHAAHEGIAFDDENNLVLVAGNMVSDTGWEGIYFDDYNGGEYLDPVLGPQPGFVAVIGNTVMRSGLDKSDDFQSGIKFYDDNVAVVLGNTIIDPGTNGIEFVNYNAAIVAGNMIAGVRAGNGIHMNGRFNELVFGGNRFGSVAGNLFHFDAPGNDLPPASTVATLLQGALGANPAFVAQARKAALAIGVSNAEFDRIIADLTRTLLSPNVAMVAPGGLLCGQFHPTIPGFSGTLNIVDPSGGLRTFTDGC
ncbi:right-handed parallel beta-helix repeat-containing protein [Hoeflea sp. TYP-13]|uniref:right-handed parallel beta-helix repeat-containing protein n=1 Tax=Hoeflea sp. TYP-13 TaxID=3230023 RepID=UPI0034C5F28E